MNADFFKGNKHIIIHSINKCCLQNSKEKEYLQREQPGQIILKL